MKIADFLCLHMTVRHAHPDIGQFFLCGVNVGVALCLCQMNWHRRLHLFQIVVRSLNLIYGNRHSLYRLLRDNTVSPPLHNNLILSRVISVRKRHLRLIGRTHPPLDHAVNPSALLHGIFG